MKIKTAELQGRALDWAVAKCEGRGKTYMDYFASQWHLNKSLRYSSAWATGGPIIDREKIGVYPSQSMSGEWASRPNYEIYPSTPHMYGPTSLTAAMRCYVASKLGDEVEVPDELIEHGETK